jgi:hypothetical protein
MTNINLNDKIGDSGKLEKSEAEPNDFKDSGEKEIKRGMLPKGGIDAIKESVKEGRALREGKNKEKPKSDGPKPSISDFLKKIREAPVSDEPHEDPDKKPDKAIEEYESKEKAKAGGSKLDINEFLRRSREKSSPNEAANAKQEFIQHILKLAIKEKIDVKYKEKLIDLISKEYGKTGFVETEIIERLSRIEEKLAVGDEPQNEVKKSLIKKTITKDAGNEKFLKNATLKLPKYVNPYYLYFFLFNYNQNPVLRSTCHDIDADELKKINDYCQSDSYDFHKHLQKIKESYKWHEKKYTAPPKIKALIRGYLTGIDYKNEPLKQGWSSDKILINWSSQELFLWTKENPNIPPNFNQSLVGNDEIEALPIDQIVSSITKEPIQNFSQLVLHFKNLFHLKRGDQSLREILIRINSDKNWNNQVDFTVSEDFSPNLEHFTDVDKLIQAYNKLIRLIIEEHQKEEKPVVKLTYKEENQCIYLAIHHLNSRYNKTIQNTIDRIGQTYSSLIENQINGLCNFHLRADFGMKNFAEINLWDGKKRHAKAITQFIGVEHILEFPKNIKS